MPSRSAGAAGGASAEDVELSTRPAHRHDAADADADAGAAGIAGVASAEDVELSSSTLDLEWASLPSTVSWNLMPSRSAGAAGVSSVEDVELPTRPAHRRDAADADAGASEIAGGGWPRPLTVSEIERVYAVPGNRQCADCVRAAPGPDGAPALPNWASTNLAVTLSPQAAGVHRSMGTHVSKVLSLTLDHWTEEAYAAMLAGGNEALNAELECHPAAADVKPDLEAEQDLRGLEAYIRSKYVDRAFAKGGSGQLIEVQQLTACAVAATEFAGILFVRVKSARHLPSMDIGSESDPYVTVRLKGGHQTMQTKTVQDNNNAVWNETLTLNYRSLQSDVLELSVWDADLIKHDDFIGRCEVAARRVHARARSAGCLLRALQPCSPPPLGPPTVPGTRARVFAHPPACVPHTNDHQVRLGALLEAQVPADRPHPFTLPLTGDGGEAEEVIECAGFHYGGCCVFGPCRFVGGEEEEEVEEVEEEEAGGEGSRFQGRISVVGVHVHKVAACGLFLPSPLFRCLLHGGFLPAP